MIYFSEIDLVSVAFSLILPATQDFRAYLERIHHDTYTLKATSCEGGF